MREKISFQVLPEECPGNVYDQNGNTTTDGLRGMTLTYNVLNLPSGISKGTDNLSYIYSASGEKLAKKMKDGTWQYYSEYTSISISAADLKSYSSAQKGTPNAIFKSAIDSNSSFSSPGRGKYYPEINLLEISRQVK
jgi:hypothetical protein